MHPFRFVDFLSPGRVLRWRSVLWESQYWTEDRWRSLQGKLLNKMLSYCQHRIPYYQRTWVSLGITPSDIRSSADISLLPIVTRESLRDHPDQFSPRNLGRFRTNVHLTSGTTGTPLRVIWDSRVNVMELVCQWRHFSWFGYKLGEAFLDLRDFKSHLAGRTHRWNWKCRSLELSARDITKANISEFAELLRYYRIKFWRGHPSALTHLAGLLSEAGINDVRPRFIITISEMLWPEQRKLLEIWPSSSIGINYGLNERTALIHECPYGGLHVAVEYGLVEIIKDDGRPAREGEEGRIISTGLHNRALPLLRYDTGDYAVATARTCPCGRTLPLVERIAGRANDRLWDSQGRWYLGLQHIIKYGEGILESQIVQREVGLAEVYIVPKSDYSQEKRKKIIDLLKAELGDSMSVLIREVGSLPFPAKNKSRLVVSLLKDPPQT